jgi:hypothetical protein
MLLGANGLDPKRFKSWIFTPGMHFKSPNKWWGDLGKRDFPHEGIDFCLYRDDTGRIVRLDQKTRLPAMHSGSIKSLFNDYLGQAMVIEHDAESSQAVPLISIYAHTTPLDHINTGYTVAKGEIIATIADTSQSKAKILPHLHYTIGIPRAKLVVDSFVWNHMRDPDRIALLDPIGLLDWPYETGDYRSIMTVSSNLSE